MIGIWFLVLICLLSTCVVSAVTLEVGPGKHYSSIQSAVNAAQPGDTVTVSPGTYNERVTISRSGIVGAKIVVRASPRREAEMQGFSISGDYVRVEGFKISDKNIDVGGDHVDVVDNYLNDVKARAITSSGASTYIANNKIYKSQMGIQVSGRDSVVENNEVERLYDWGALNDCDYSRFFGDGHVFRNNYFHGTIRTEVGRAHVDCFQTFDDRGQSASNILLEGNTCYDFSQGLMSSAVRKGDTHHITVRNNVFSHGTNGVIARDGMSYITVDHNTIVDMRYYGVWFYKRIISSAYGVRNGVIKNNIVYDTGKGIVVASSISEADVDYNLVNNTNRISGGSQGLHNKVGADPMFEDRGANNFKPKEGSPACGAGEDGSDIGAIPCSGSSGKSKSEG